MRKIILLFWISVSLLRLEASGQCSGSIHGHIYDKKSKATLKGALVEMVNQNYSVINKPKEGEFLFENVCEGDYVIKIFKDGYDTLWVKARITAKTLHFHQDIFLEKNEDMLEGVEVESQKEGVIQTQILENLSEQEIQSSRGKTLGEMLKSVAGVSALNTGAGISKPMIHGLHSQRILILNNGVRQEGQQWGEEHAPEIDPFSAEQVAVLKGAAGVRYGSDAMAGVVVLNPKALPTHHRFSGSAYLIGHSNSRMGNAALQMQKGFGKGWAWRFQTSLKRGGDFHTPTYVLSNTGTQEMNFSGTLGYTHQKWNIRAYISRYDSEIGILRAAHTGNVEDLANSISRPEPWYVAPFTYTIENPRQRIIHYLGKVNAEVQLTHIGKLSLQYAFQDNVRKEYDIRRAGRSVMPALSLELQSHTLETTLEHHAWKNFRGSIGLSTLYQTNYNVPETGIVPLLPNFTNFTQGIFWIERFVKPKYDLEWGLRYDYRTTEVRTFIQNRTFIKPNYDFHYATATVGYGFYPNNEFTFKTNLGMTFRPPHTAELFSQGLHLGIGNIQEGLLFENGFLNPQKPFSIEKSYKWVASASYKKQNWQLEVQPFYNWINDFIYLTPTDIRLTIRGTFPVFSYVQEDIIMKGIDVMSLYRLGKWSWQTKLAYVHAQTQEARAPIINMPPLRWENKVAFTQKQWKKLENVEIFATLLHISKQRHAPRVVSPSSFASMSSQEQQELLQQGNFDFMEAPDGYFLLGMGMQATYKRLTTALKVENLTNTMYRDYLNRWRYYANDLGRNFILQINYQF
jgi:iron complex outermembrane receptor protein